MIIEDGKNGFLVPVGDEKTLVQKMKKITEMDTCVAVSEKAKKLKEQLDARVIAEQYGCITTSDDASTSRAGVFAGGDDVTGPLTVVKAMKAGRIAAASMDEYMNK